MFEADGTLQVYLPVSTERVRHPTQKPATCLFPTDLALLT